MARPSPAADAAQTAARHEGSGGFHPGSALLLARPSGRRPLQVTVSPLRLRVPILAGAPPRALVLVADPDARVLPLEDVWRQLFGLTAAETRVAKLLSIGLHVPECAAALAVGEATIRTHLKRLIHKTGSHTQSDLMRALVAGPALGAPPDPDDGVDVG